MNEMKRLGFMLVALMLCMAASAQITWNVKAGGGFSTMRGDVEEAQGKFGYKIGVGIEKPLSADWLIMPSLEFKQKGTQFDREGEKEVVTYSYIQLPVLGAWRTRLTDDMNLTLKAGPYFAYALSGKDEYTYEGMTEEEDLFGEDGTGKRFDAGILLGVDVEYRRFVIGAEFEYGMTPCAKYSEYDDFTAYNMGVYLTLGYKF